MLILAYVRLFGSGKIYEPCEVRIPALSEAIIRDQNSPTVYKPCVI
jgi:hypothetical protein